MTYSKNIRFLRKSCKLSQEELADLLGVKRHTICDWETARTEPNVTHIKNIAELFNVTVNFLLGLDEVKYNEDLGFDAQKDYMGYVARNDLEKELMELVDSCNDEQLELVQKILDGTKLF